MKTKVYALITEYANGTEAVTAIATHMGILCAVTTDEKLFETVCEMVMTNIDRATSDGPILTIRKVALEVSEELGVLHSEVKK